MKNLCPLFFFFTLLFIVPNFLYCQTVDLQLTDSDEILLNKQEGRSQFAYYISVGVHLIPIVKNDTLVYGEFEARLRHTNGKTDTLLVSLEGSSGEYYSSIIEGYTIRSVQLLESGELMLLAFKSDPDDISVDSAWKVIKIDKSGDESIFELSIEEKEYPVNVVFFGEKHNKSLVYSIKNNRKKKDISQRLTSYKFIDGFQDTISHLEYSDDELLATYNPKVKANNLIYSALIWDPTPRAVETVTLEDQSKIVFFNHSTLGSDLRVGVVTHWTSGYVLLKLSVDGEILWSNSQVTNYQYKSENERNIPYDNTTYGGIFMLIDSKENAHLIWNNARILFDDQGNRNEAFIKKTVFRLEKLVPAVTSFNSEGLQYSYKSLVNIDSGTLVEPNKIQVANKNSLLLPLRNVNNSQVKLLRIE